MKVCCCLVLAVLAGLTACAAARNVRVAVPYAEKLDMVMKFRNGATADSLHPQFEEILREYINSERCMQ